MNLKKYHVSTKSILLNDYFLNSNKNLVPPIITESMERTKEQHFEYLRHLVDERKPGDVIAMVSLFDISESIDDTVDFYTYAWKAKVYLQFVETPWVNSDFLRNNGVTILAARKIIAKTIESKKYFSHQRDEANRTVRRTKKGYPSPLKGRKLHSSKRERLKPEILKRSKTFGGTESDAALIREFGITRNTYYNYKKAIREEILQKQKEKSKQA